MLRTFVLLLLLLNGLFFAWGQGWLLAYGFGPTPQSEPQRLLQQIRPEVIQLISAAEAEAAKGAAEEAKGAAEVAKAPVAASPSKALCLQSAVFDLTRAETVRAVLNASLPSGSWILEDVALPERWIIYMGKYVNADELAKKRAQLTSLGLRFESVNSATLVPGLSLGVFASEAQASATLAGYVSRGVRTARVLLETPAGPGLRLRLPAVDDVLQQRLPTLRAALPGQSLTPCLGGNEPR